MESKYGNLLSIVLVVSIVVVVGILSFLGYKVYTSNKTNKESQNVAADFDKYTNNTENTESTDNDGNNTEDNNNDGSLSLNDVLASLGTDNSGSIYEQGQKKDILYEGYRVIGTISIPTIDIEYPILEENSSDTLKIAIVCVYPQDDRANAVNKPGNLVLWGHNYKNGKFFSDLTKLTTGDKVYIKDLTGKRVEYQVYNTYETTDSDFTYATRNTDGACEISLSTCSNGSGKRNIVWARETN